METSNTMLYHNALKMTCKRKMREVVDLKTAETVLEQNTVGRRKKGFLYEMGRHKILYFMILPTIIYFVIFNYLPMAGVYLAFTSFNFKDGLFHSPFCGFDNFKTLFTSGVLTRLLVNTVLYNIAFIVIGNLVEMLLAVVLSRFASRFFKKIVQTLSFMPYFVSYVIVASFAYILFNSGTGSFTLFVQSLGFKDFSTYGTPAIWPGIIVLVYLWKSVGYGMVVYLASVTSIDESLYEAAKIDGATIHQQMKYITIPMLVPTLITLLLFALGSIARGQFELFYQLCGSQGQLYGVTDIFDTYVFRMLQGTFDVGRGTAIGLFQSLFGLIVVCTVNRIVNKYNSDYALF